MWKANKQQASETEAQIYIYIYEKMGLKQKHYM